MSNKQFDEAHDFPTLSAPSGKPVLTADLTADGGGGGVTTFRELTDTPGDYIGYAGYVPVVAGNESGLGFIAFDHDLLANTHNLTTDIDHDQLLNYVGAEHVDWTVTGAEQIHIDRLNLSAINAPDDDFHVNLSLISAIADGDELLIADADDSFNYKRILYSDLVSALSTVQNAYTSIIVDSGTTVLDAVGADDLVISGDGTIIETVGSQPGTNTISLSFLSQSSNLFLAGPPSGLADTPDFRSLVDADMPASYEPTNWGAAYTHSLDTTTNPHNITLADIGGDFGNDINVVLSAGKNIGQFTNGDTIPSAGLTAEEVIELLATEYINASFDSFSVDQATTVEVGTSLSGTKDFSWSIDQGSGFVQVLDIYDITAATNLSTDLAENTSPETITITTIELATEGSTQQWRGIGTDETPSPEVNFNSSTFTVTARHYRWWDATNTAITTSALVRGLTNSAWQTGTDTFTLNTGSTVYTFWVCLPPGIEIISVIDLDALNLDITSEYVQQTDINVSDNNGSGPTTWAYNIYKMTQAIPYTTSHRHQITAG